MSYEKLTTISKLNIKEELMKKSKQQEIGEELAEIIKHITKEFCPYNCAEWAEQYNDMIDTFVEKWGK